MAVLFGAAVFCIAFGAFAIAYRAAPEAVRRRDAAAIAVAVAAPVVWATFLELHPTGIVLWDAVLTASVPLVAGTLAATAERRVVAVVALVLGACAMNGSAGVLAAGASAGIAVSAAALRIRLPAPKALAGSLAGLALVQLRWPEPTGIRTALAIAVVVALGVAAAARASAKHRRRTFVTAGVVIGALALVGVAFGLTALRVRDDLDGAVAIARTGLRAAQRGDMRSASASLDRASIRFSRADERLDQWYVQPVRLVPGIARNQRAAAAVTSSGTAIARAAARVAGDGDAGDVRLHDGTVDLARVERLRDAVNEITGQLTVARDRLVRADSTWLVPQVDDALTKMRVEVDKAARSTSTTAHIARRLPTLLGADGPRHWFVGVLGNSEARATGGIIGSYGILTTDHGHLSLGDMHRTAELNSATPRTLTDVDEYVARYGTFEPDRTWQNITLSPDGPTVARVVEQLLPQATGERVDGTILVDAFGLAALLRVVGPVDVASWPTPLTTDTVPHVLLHDEYVRFPRPDRVDFLGDVAHATFDRITSGDLPAPSKLASLLSPAVRGGHLLLHSTDAREQDLFGELRADGAMPAVHGDSLALVTQNASGNKIDWFLRRGVDYDVTVGSSGSTRAEATITLTNTAPTSGEPDYVIAGSGPHPTGRGVNRTILSLYSPLDLVSSSVPMDRATELDRNVYTAFVDIPPGGTVTVHVQLAGRLALDDGYHLDVRPQATVVPDRLRVRVDGRPYP